MPHVLASDLRSAVLQAAAQGKLTEHLESDEPIGALKEKLIIDDKLVFPENLPCDIPDYWEWIQIGNLGESIGTDSFSDGPFGSNLKKEHQIQRPEVRIIQLSNIGENGWKDENVKYTSFDHLDNVIPRCEVHPGDFVIAKMMPAGRTIEVPELNTRITLGSDAMKFVPNKNLNKTYLLYVMHSNAFLDQVYSEAHGITRVRTTLNGVKSYVLPIPPIEEQARIVARVDELMAKIDEYEKIEKELVELHKAFPGNMKDAVLQAAMQGKLTEQLEGDGNAHDLISSIDKIREKGIKDKKIRKAKGINTFTEDDIPYDVPEHWGWMRFGSLVANCDGERKPVSKELRVKSAGGIYPYYGATGAIDKVDDYLFDGEYLMIGEDGGNFFVNRDNSFIANGKFWANNHVHVVKPIEMNIKYLKGFLDSCNLPLMGLINGIAVPKLNQENLNSIMVPVPPLEEQQRIVDKLDRLLPLCESLEAML